MTLMMFNSYILTCIEAYESVGVIIVSGCYQGQW